MLRHEMRSINGIPQFDVSKLIAALERHCGGIFGRDHARSRTEKALTWIQKIFSSEDTFSYFQILCCENRKYLETVLGSDHPPARIIAARS